MAGGPLGVFHLLLVHADTLYIFVFVLCVFFFGDKEREGERESIKLKGEGGVEDKGEV